MSKLILAVDDDRNVIEVARAALEVEGFRVESATTGTEALARFRILKPSLIVLDIILPELDGMEICRRIRAESDIPIIMLTARAEDVDKIVGLGLGADDYVTKPFNPRELAARVKAVLRRYEKSLEEQLLDMVWGYEFYGTTRTVDIHISRLREKLSGSNVFIETAHGLGYRLVVENSPLGG